MSDETGLTPKAGRGMRWLLIASLALNLLVVGIVVGAMFGGPGRDHRAGQPRDAVAPYTRALAPRDRRALRRELRQSLFDRRPSSDALAAPYMQVVALLRAAPFDADALRTALTAQSAQAQARLTAGREVLLAHISAMTDAERRAYSDRLEAEIARLADDRRPGWRRD